MKNKPIFFTGVHKAELLECGVWPVKADEILAETGGAGRACLMDIQNTSRKFSTGIVFDWRNI